MPARGTAAGRELPCSPAGGSALDLTIASDVQAIEGVVDAVVARCAAHAYPRRVCSLNVPVALSEALANAILRGNRERADKRVRVRACVDDAQLVVEVQDEGEAFDIDACFADPRAADRLEREDGRGIFLMRALMDRVERYAAEPSGSETRGNVVRLTLRRPAGS